jgi:hypothetical protein
MTRAPYMPGLQKLVREAAHRYRGIQPRNAAVPCIFALSRYCRPRYRSLVTPSGSAPPPYSPISLSVLACYRESSCRPRHSQEILAGAYSPDLAASEVRGIWPARDFPYLLSIRPPVLLSIEGSCGDLQFLPLRPAYLVSRNVSQSP